MAATGHKGIDVRQTGNRIISDVFLLDYAGSLVTSGTTNLYFYELQDDGSLKSFDFSDYTFKTTALTNETTGMIHRTGNNSTTNTGLWTLAVSNVSGFTIGAIYYARARNVLATPADQIIKFQYGSAEGDLIVDSTFNINVNVMKWASGTVPTPNFTGIPKVDVLYWNGVTTTQTWTGYPPKAF